MIFNDIFPTKTHNDFYEADNCNYVDNDHSGQALLNGLVASAADLLCVISDVVPDCLAKTEDGLQIND
jgi:hypothetical protein